MTKFKHKTDFAQANKAMLLFAVIPLLLSILLYSQQLLIYQQTIANIQKQMQLL